MRTVLLPSSRVPGKPIDTLRENAARKSYGSPGARTLATSGVAGMAANLSGLRLRIIIYVVLVDLGMTPISNAFIRADHGIVW